MHSAKKAALREIGYLVAIKMVILKFKELFILLYSNYIGLVNEKNAERKCFITSFVKKINSILSSALIFVLLTLGYAYNIIF